jgi:predicted Zn-dependent protease
MSRGQVSGFILTADTLRRAGDYERAETVMERAVELIPQAENAVDYLAQIYVEQGKSEELRRLLQQFDRHDDPDMLFMLGQASLVAGSRPEAAESFRRTLTMNPRHRQAMQELTKLLLESGEIEAARQVLKTWIHHNADDARAASFLQELEKQYSAPDTADTAK